MNVDTSSDFYYDPTTGELIGVTASSAVFHTTDCVAGPPGFLASTASDGGSGGGSTCKPVEVDCCFNGCNEPCSPSSARPCPGPSSLQRCNCEGTAWGACTQVLSLDAGPVACDAGTD